MACSIYKFHSVAEARELLRKLSSRQAEGQDVEAQVRAILDEVRLKKDAALVEMTRRFDCPEFTGSIRVDSKEIQVAAAAVKPAELDIITAAAANIREFHTAQKEKSWFVTRPDGSILGQKVTAVDRAGLYIPGGQGGNTPLISSLLMQAIPAQVAGVKEIALVTPPRADGTLNPYLLAAAYLLDLNEIYKVGGPWAIGAMAYGTESIAPVDVITGPGNTFVTTAKKLVQGQVGIDMLAGPSEILVLADDSANYDWIAADMLSQAEHDSLASAVCITNNQLLADRVVAALNARVIDLPRSEIAQKSIDNWGAVIVVPNLQVGIDIANAIAPEHMEVLIRDPWSVVSEIQHAGALFLGPWSPEPVGDYFAGPNHVLPTQSTARHSSALSVQTFCKKTSIIAASQKFTQESISSIASLARLEALEGHARSVEVRK